LSHEILYRLRYINAGIISVISLHFNFARNYRFFFNKSSSKRTTGLSYSVLSCDMNQFNTSVEVRWADLDPNFHLRHSVYYDYGAFCRVKFLASHGITAQFMLERQFGPIIFREECVFKKEIQLSDEVTIDVRLVKARKDGSRWTMQHQIFKKNEIVAAILTLDGAWMDIQKRKLAVPPFEVQQTFDLAPKSEGFEWI
jgi:acyl-CoA thioester hydrolase